MSKTVYGCVPVGKIFAGLIQGLLSALTISLVWGVHQVKIVVSDGLLKVYTEFVGSPTKRFRLVTKLELSAYTGPDPKQPTFKFSPVK